MNLTEIPQTKDEFFSKIVSDENNEDSVKRIISESVSNFLEENNEIINEVKKLLEL